MKKKIVSLFLICLLALSFTLAGCDGCKKKKSANDVNNTDNALQLDTVHGGKAEETDAYILQNGNTKYTIVLPQEPTVNENNAASTLQKYFMQATGITLSIVKESADIGEIDTAFSLGNTAMANAVGIRYAYSDRSNAGYAIRTVGKSIYCVGGTYGVQYAVYDLLERWFGFDYYSAYTYSLQRGVSDLKLFDYDINELPDFKAAPAACGLVTLSDDSELKSAWRYNRDADGLAYMGYKGTNMHNTFRNVPWETYGKEHRDWFSDSVDGRGVPYQLCFSRDPDGLLELVLENSKQTLLEYPNVNVVMFSQEDNRNWCSCEHCTALENQYGGSQSAGYARFMRKLGDALNEWSVQTLGKEAYVLGLAYQPTLVAPTVYDEKTDTYTAIDDSVDLGEHAFMMYCPIDSDYQIAFDEKGNERDMQALRSWSALTDRLYVFSYNVRTYVEYLIFYDNFNSMQRNFQLLYTYKTQHLYDMGTYGSKNATGFNTLKEYISAKLKWNVKSDVAALTDKWFANSYGDAAAVMREMFDALRNTYTYLHATGALTANYSAWTWDDLVYSEGFIDSLLGYIDKAYAAIEPLKETNAETYEAIHDRICLESISARFLQLLRFSYRFDKTTLYQMQSAFKADCERLNINLRGENRSMQEYVYDLWGI